MAEAPQAPSAIPSHVLVPWAAPGCGCTVGFAKLWGFFKVEMSRALRVTHPCCPQGHRASPQTHSIPQKTSFPQKTASPSCCGKGRECTRTQPQLLGLSARGFPQASLPAQQEPHPGCARAELCHPSPRPPADLSLPQGVEDAAGKCFNSNHPLIYFFKLHNCCRHFCSCLVLLHLCGYSTSSKFWASTELAKCSKNICPELLPLQKTSHTRGFICNRENSYS